MTNERKHWHKTLPPLERKLYFVRRTLIWRCHSKSAWNFNFYGGRGIAVCDEWRKSWPAFRDWGLSHGYRHGLQIDRIDNSRGYSPENCRFVTPKENSRNRRSNRSISFRGETHVLIEWCEILGIHKGTLWARLNDLGWSVERAFTTPVRRVKRKTLERLVKGKREEGKEKTNNQTTNN